ncbi:hypothetical protein BDA96_03G238600 [Sorghum bicolor]|uniref:Uncharacterized protein n=2 Tax=Sorghum bicolor TaxID=4558 RepID=A0A921UPF3_SORBI|nr:hypothetical protein BDA96_03G238600 [Sorghum bicolor]OQU87170.1 hypothetical protein SORBI_3003G220332 [Sorghum bicolor]
MPGRQRGPGLVQCTAQGHMAYYVTCTAVCHVLLLPMDASTGTSSSSSSHSRFGGIFFVSPARVCALCTRQIPRHCAGVAYSSYSVCYVRQVILISYRLERW